MRPASIRVQRSRYRLQMVLLGATVSVGYFAIRRRAGYWRSPGYTKLVVRERGPPSALLAWQCLLSWYMGWLGLCGAYEFASLSCSAATGPSPLDEDQSSRIGAALFRWFQVSTWNRSRIRSSVLGWIHCRRHRSAVRWLPWIHSPLPGGSGADRRLWAARSSHRWREQPVLFSLTRRLGRPGITAGGSSASGTFGVPVATRRGEPAPQRTASRRETSLRSYL
jgi:hypothetical protein